MRRGQVEPRAAIKEEPGGSGRKKSPGESRRSKEEPGGAKRSQEKPGCVGKSQEEPEMARRGQEGPPYLRFAILLCNRTLTSKGHGEYVQNIIVLCMKLADSSLLQLGEICFPSQGHGALIAHGLADPYIIFPAFEAGRTGGPV